MGCCWAWIYQITNILCYTREICLHCNLLFYSSMVSRHGGKVPTKTILERALNRLKDDDITEQFMEDYEGSNS